MFFLRFLVQNSPKSNTFVHFQYQIGKNGWGLLSTNRGLVNVHTRNLRMTNNLLINIAVNTAFNSNDIDTIVVRDQDPKNSEIIYGFQ